MFLSLELDAAEGRSTVSAAGGSTVPAAGGNTVPAALRSSVITEGEGAGTTSATQDGNARM